MSKSPFEISSPIISTALTEHVLVQRADGELSVVMFAPDVADTEIETELAKHALRWGAPATAWKRINPADLPTDRAFRDAWRVDGENVAVDMDKARAITRDRLRTERSPILLSLDVETMKAIETGDQAKIDTLAAEKQRLRDITALPAIDAAKTPEDLKAITIDKPEQIRVSGVRK